MIDGGKDKEMFEIDTEIPHQQLQLQRKKVVDTERKANMRESGKYGTLDLPQQWRANQQCLPRLTLRQPILERIHGPFGRKMRKQLDQNVKMTLALLHGKREPAALMPGDKDGVRLLLDGIDHIGQPRRMRT